MGGRSFDPYSSLKKNGNLLPARYDAYLSSPSRRYFATPSKGTSSLSDKVRLSNLENDRYLPYPKLQATLACARRRLNGPLSLSQKILYSHLCEPETQDVEPLKSFLKLYPDRAACHDATATMALLQFISAGLPATAIPTTIHSDHLIVAEHGDQADLEAAKEQHKEVYNFLSTTSKRYGIGYWKAGSGIIHTIIFENYAL